MSLLAHLRPSPHIEPTMTSDKIDILQTMLQQQPDNPLARYGLAIEYSNRGQHELAATEFDTLLAAHPDYVAGYFHSGRNLEKLGRVDDACEIYRRGIDAATRKGDMHSRSELQAALDMAGI